LANHGFDLIVLSLNRYIKSKCMKKLFVLSILLIPILIQAQRKPKIKGSRVVTEVKGELPAYNAISLVDPLDITLKKSFGPGYSLVADDNLVDILKFEVVDSTLVISSYYDIRSKKQLEITVEYTQLKAISLKAGSITGMDVIESDELFVDGFNNSRLDLRASGGVMDLNLEDNSGGNFSVDMDSLNISLGSRAQAYVYSVGETAQIDLEDQASLTLEGSSNKIGMMMQGSSKYRGETMEVGDMSLEMQHSPSAQVQAYGELELSLKGSSRVYLYGTPSLVIKEFLDTSQLIKRQQ